MAKSLKIYGTIWEASATFYIRNKHISLTDPTFRFKISKYPPDTPFPCKSWSGITDPLYPTFPKFLPHVQPIARPLPVCIHCWFSKTEFHEKQVDYIITEKLLLRWTLSQREMQLLFSDKVTLWYWEVKASAYHNQRKNWCILRNQ